MYVKHILFQQIRHEINEEQESLKKLEAHASMAEAN